MSKIVIPTDPTELEEMISDQSKVQELFKNGQFAEFVGAYARHTMDKDQRLSQQIQDETQRVMAQWLKDHEQENVKRLNLSPDNRQSRTSADKGGAYNHAAPGAKLDEAGIVKDASEFFKAIWFRNQSASAIEIQNKILQIQNAFGSQVPGDGGFLIPESLRSELLRVSLENSIVRSRARVIPMETLRVPFPSIDSTSNASSVHGGIVTYWTEEAGALTQSSAKFGRVVLEAKKLTAYSEVPNELFADAILALMVFLETVFPEALAFEEDYRFMLGSGVGEPLGFVNCPASVAVAKETGQASATIVWENLVKMFSRMLPTSLNRAVWLASPDTFPELATMALSVGTGGGPVWLNNGAAGPPMTILGRPVIFTEKLPTVGTTGDICFSDLGYYLIGDRQQMQAETSTHYKFANDQTAIRFIQRVDGRPWIQSALTPKNNSSNTLSPFVQTATR